MPPTELPEPKKIDHPAMEWVEQDIHDRFENFESAENSDLLSGSAGDRSFKASVGNLINTYAGTPDQAGANFYDFIATLPSSDSLDVADAYYAYLTLWHTRHGLYLLVQDDAIAAEMFRDEGENQDVDLSAAKDGETPMSKQRDAEVSASAAENQVASDSEIGDIAFGGDADKIHDNVRESAMGQQDLRKMKFLLPDKTVEMLKTNGGVPDQLVVAEPSFIMSDPRSCFRSSTSWLARTIVQRSIGKELRSVKGPSHPRIQPIIGKGITDRHVAGIIKNIRRLQSALKPPSYDDGRQTL